MSETTECVVGRCRCGGYGVVYDEEHERTEGRCHDPFPVMEAADLIREALHLVGAVAVGADHTPLADMARELARRIHEPQPTPEPPEEPAEGEREVHELIADAWLTDEEEWEDRDGNIQRTWTVTTDPHGREEPATAVRLIQTRENLALEDRPEPAPPETEGGEAWEEVVAWLSVALRYLERGAEPTSEHYKAAQAQIGNAIHAIERSARLPRTPTASDPSVEDVLAHVESAISDSMPDHSAGQVRQRVRLAVRQARYGTVPSRVAPTASPDTIEALAERAAYHKGWEDALASLGSRTTASVEFEAPTARRVSREELAHVVGAILQAHDPMTPPTEADVDDAICRLEDVPGIEIEGEGGDDADTP